MSRLTDSSLTVQLRDAIGHQDSYRYLIHDRDRIFAKALG
jgi:hypothetical protein